MAALQQKLDHAEKDHTEKIKLKEEQFEASETKYREELEFLKKLASENEEIQRRRLQEDFNSNIEAVRQEYERKISDLEQNLELAKKEWITETEMLKETRQIALQKTQEDSDNLKEMISRLTKQHEDEVRYLEEQLEINAEQFDMERERLLLVQEELSEQIALKESYLQDVQEEEEDFNKKTQKPSESIKALDSSVLEDPENETDKLRLALYDLQSQNTMLKEELTFLTNVKTELEGDLKHLKQEFSMEREELEFKINELQMTKEEGELGPEMEVNCMNALETIRLEEHNQIIQELKELHKAERKELEAHLISSNECEKELIAQEVQDLQNACKVLSEEKKAIVSEYEHTKEILRNIEMELGDRTSEFVKKYNAMKEQAAASIQELEEKLRGKDSMIEKLKCLEQTRDHSEQKLEDIVPEDKEEVHKENKVILEEMLTYIEKLRDECKDGGMDTAQITLQKLEDLSMSLEGALDEKKSPRCSIAEFESQLSFSAHEKDQPAKRCNTSVEGLAESNEEMAELQKDHQSALQERDALRKDLEISEEKLFKARKQVCNILAQNYSVKTDEERDISVLLNHLLSRVEEDKSTCIVSNEEKAKLQNDLQAVSDERNGLKKVIETNERKLFDTQRHVCEILEQHYSVKTVGEEDISILLNNLLSSIHKEKKSYVMLNEEKIKQQRDLLSVVEERDDLKRCMKTHERKLSDVRKNVCEMLEQNYSVNIDEEEEDISVLLKHLLSRVQEEKLILTQQLEEKAVQLSQQKQQAELRDTGDLQKTSRNEVLSNTEHLQGDQHEHVEITGRLVGQEHEEPAGEGGAQATDDMKNLQQKLSEKESIVAHLKEEISHLQVCSCYV